MQILKPLKELKPKFQQFGKLPGKPSELIKIAVDDLVKSEKAGLKINMDRWVSVKKVRNSQVCTVCLAGSIMANRLNDEPLIKEAVSRNGVKFNVTEHGVQETKFDDYNNKYVPTGKRRAPEGNESLIDIQPWTFSEESSALGAVNSFREGDLEEAFSELNLDLPANFLPKVKIVSYRKDPAMFKRQMRSLAKSLAAAGY